MSTKRFAEAMNEVADRYYDEAALYYPKRISGGGRKWWPMVACIAIVALLGIGVWRGVWWRFNSEPWDATPNKVSTSSIADIAPLIFVNNTLYKQSITQASYDEIDDNAKYLGEIKSDISREDGYEQGTGGVPAANFQANIPIVGAKIYQYGENIAV